MRLSLLLAAIPAVLADKFIQSCSKTSIVVKDNLMSGRCWNTHGELICSQLDLNYCIRSDYGVLREDPNGVGYATYPKSVDQ